ATSVPRHVSPRADGAPDVGLRQGRSVVHTVPGPGRDQAAPPDLLHLLRLLAREYRGEVTVQLQLLGDPAASPVSSRTRTPTCLSRRSASRAPGRRTSASAIAPWAWSPARAETTVLPCPAVPRTRRPSTAMPCSRRQPGLTTCTGSPFTTACA